MHINLNFYIHPSFYLIFLTPFFVFQFLFIHFPPFTFFFYFFSFLFLSSIPPFLFPFFFTLLFSLFSFYISSGMCASLSIMREGCDPLIFYHRVRPFLSAWKNNPILPNGVMYEVWK